MKQLSKFIGLTAVALVLALPARAALVTWSGGNFSWNQPDSDSFGATYNSGDDVLFNGAGTGTDITVAAGGVTPGNFALSSGTYRFVGGNINAGSFTLSGGTLQWTNSNQLGTGVINVTGNATIQQVRSGTGPATMNNAGIVVSNGVTLTVRQSNNNSTGTAGSPPTVAPISGGSLATPITLNLTANVSQQRWRLSNSSFIGAVNINASRIVFEGFNTAHFGNAANTVNVSASSGLEINGGGTIAQNITLANGTFIGTAFGGAGTVILNGIVTQAGTTEAIGTVRLNNSASTFNLFTLNNRTFQLGYLPNGGTIRNITSSGSGSTVQFLGDLVGNSAVNLTSQAGFLTTINVNSANADITLSQPLAATGSGERPWAKTGPGTLVLNGGGALAIDTDSRLFVGVGGGTLILNNNLTRVGNISINGEALVVGGANGRLNTGAYSGLITNNARFLYASAQNQTLSGIMRGTGSLTKSGSGVLTLTAVNEYTGATIINAGTLLVNQYNGLANNGSEKVTISAFNAVGRTNFTGAATLGRVITAGSSFAGYGSSVTNGTVATTAAIRQGRNTFDSSLTLTMQWRPREAADAAPFAPSPISDVVNVTGIDLQPFTLQMSYLGDAFDTMSLSLGWLNTNSMTWGNAVLGNHNPGSTQVANYQGSWTTFAGLYSITDATLGQYVGSWGVDTSPGGGGVVWAVLDHNSQFAVLAIPEPSTVILMLVGGGLCWWRRRR